MSRHKPHARMLDSPLIGCARSSRDDRNVITDFELGISTNSTFTKGNRLLRLPASSSSADASVVQFVEEMS